MIYPFLYSMKIKEQTRKLATGCSKYCFEVVDRTDEVSNHTYGKATLTWFKFDFRRVLDKIDPNPQHSKKSEFQSKLAFLQNVLV